MLPILFRHIGAESERAGNASVVHRAIQTPERIDRRRDGRLHLLGLRHVASKGDRFAASGLNLRRRFLRAGRGHIHNRDARAFLRRQLGRRPANTRRCSRQQNRFACQSIHPHASSFFWIL